MLAVALTIAGSDSSGGAGIQADLKAMFANGVYGASVLTAITAQNTHSVTGVHVLPAAFVTQQLDAVASDLTVRATKTGMLATAAIIEAVAAGVTRHGLRPLVVDPVMVATSGATLLQERALVALKTRLLPLATLVTPNSVEAARLVGHPVETLAQAREAAQAIAALGCGAVLIKGGHLGVEASAAAATGRPDDDDAVVTDLLWDGVRFTTFDRPRLATRHTHGTGCTLASAITARLARGDGLIAAITEACAYLHGAIGHGLDLGAGPGPTDHGWFLDRSRRFSDPG